MDAYIVNGIKVDSHRFCTIPMVSKGIQVQEHPNN